MIAEKTKAPSSTSSRSRTAKHTPKPNPVLITGGAGFIGTNLAHRLLSEKQPVLLFDNLSRPGVEKNWEWLRAEHGDLVETVVGDIRDYKAVKDVVKHASKVFHLAAQVAVTTSLVNPVEDFEVNARGTLNLLEALRLRKEPAPLIYTCTNKIYGELADIRVRSGKTRYEPEEPQYRLNGFSESRPLQFHSPYGCSKGAACEYVLDYARTFKIPALVFCMSCVYGPHQFGTEDQGWVAHFLIRAFKGEPITVYGDGRQVRDLLFVDDLVSAFLLAQQHIERLSGQSFNIGGGPENTLSLIELLELIANSRNSRPKIRSKAWRQADQRYYVSDIRKFCRSTGWCPTVGVAEGVERLARWLESEVLPDQNNTATSNGSRKQAKTPVMQKG